ncbi:MAG: hypothetical protein BGN88_12965 [Clostridiales bacterium 43-6]|nr:MAG: hypothetical protein BGN88_12965 [Clostridiales bacterium 43-6]
MFTDYETELTIKAQKDGERIWCDSCVECSLPVWMLSERYGKAEPIKGGSVLHANFNQCGDETPFPHCGMWREVETDTADFHRPEFFGKLILEDCPVSLDKPSHFRDNNFILS